MQAWGSEVVRLQSAGHINVESGYGAWPLGLLLESLMDVGSWQNTLAHSAVASDELRPALAA